jgi:hypothetical protein
MFNEKDVCVQASIYNSPRLIMKVDRWENSVVFRRLSHFLTIKDQAGVLLLALGCTNEARTNGKKE